MDNNHVAGPEDESTIGETAGRLMHQFTEVPGLSLTTQQACRLVGAEAAACRIALDQLVAAGWLARNHNGLYVRAPTVGEAIDALIDRCTRRRHAGEMRGRHAMIALSPGEAFAAILLAAARADGSVTSPEAARLEDILASMRLYRDCDRDALQPLVQQLIDLLIERGDPVIVHAAAAAVPPDLKASVMALATDIVLADGVIRSGERQFLDGLQQELSLDDEITGKIFDVMVIKNRA
jgi:uncharacterized tellurite resistance protein B-like protein